MGLTGQPELDDAADDVAPVSGGDSGPVAENDDARVDRGDGFDQRHLVGRQLDRCAVASFGLVGGRKTEKQHHQLTGLREGQRLVHQSGRVLVGLQHVAGRELDGRCLTQAGL
jgi:hypothetical protein